MTSDRERAESPTVGEEEATARLLRLVGVRPDAAPERAARVREAVHGQWRLSHERRVFRRRIGITAFLGVAAALMVIVRSTSTREMAVATLNESVATSERVEGAPVARRLVGGRSIGEGLAPSAPVRSGDLIETDSTSRLALRAADGSSVRIDRDARARWVSATLIELIEGTVYIATSEGSRGFDVRTPFGTVHDVGTQFEVRLRPSSLRLRVRTGLVEVHRPDQVIPTRAGMEVTVSADAVDTTSVAAYGAEWAWTASLAPPFEIEGRSLAVSLDHLAREHGWVLHYADAALAQTASSIMLHGSVQGLNPEEVLAVALATSGLQHRLTAGELMVSRPADQR